MQNHILIVAATKQEADFLLSHIREPKTRSIGLRTAFEGRIAGQDVRLVISGAGIVNVVQSLTACIEQKQPDTIFQIGCGGAFQESGLSIGDIAIASEEVDIHLGLEPGSDGQAVKPLPFPVMMRNNKPVYNHYPLDTAIVYQSYQLLKQNPAGNNRQIGLGRFLTVATITTTDRRATTLYRKYSPVMEAMEGAGAAMLSIHYKIPLVEIRSVSNMVGRRDKAGWDIPLAGIRSGEAVYELIQLWDRQTHLDHHFSSSS